MREHWQVDSVAVKVSTNVNEATAEVDIGAPGGLQTMGVTSTGSTGDTCGVGQDIQTGQVITATWSGGDAGATAIMTVFGTYTIGAP